MENRIHKLHHRSMFELAVWRTTSPRDMKRIKCFIFTRVYFIDLPCHFQSTKDRGGKQDERARSLVHIRVSVAFSPRVRVTSRVAPLPLPPLVYSSWPIGTIPRSFAPRWRRRGLGYKRRRQGTERRRQKHEGFAKRRLRPPRQRVQRQSRRLRLPAKLHQILYLLRCRASRRDRHLAL